MSNEDAKQSFATAETKAAEAVALYARPIGGGARHSIEHQGIQALAESIEELAKGLKALAANS